MKNTGIILVGAGIAAYFLFLKPKTEEGGSGGSLAFPLDALQSGAATVVGASTDTDTFMPSGFLTELIAKKGSGRSYTSATRLNLSQYNSLAAYIPILNSAAVQTNPIRQALENTPTFGSADPTNPYGIGQKKLAPPIATKSSNQSAPTSYGGGSSLTSTGAFSSPAAKSSVAGFNKKTAANSIRAASGISSSMSSWSSGWGR